MEVNAGNWATSPSPSNASSAVNNQGHNMQNSNNQNSTSGCDSTTSSRASLPSSAASSASISSSWGVGITSTSGAQVENSSGLPTVSSMASQASAFNWQGGGISFLQQNKSQAASSESATGWGDSPVVSSVSSQGISSTDKSGTDADKTFGGSKSGTGIDGQWGANLSSNLRGPTGWDTGSGGRNSPKTGGNGWGSPIPSPNPHAGTEAWGAPESKAGPSPGGWGQSTNNSTSAWGQPNNQAESVSSSSSSWGDQSDQRSTAWGDAVERRSNPSPNPNAWGHPPQKSTTTGWGAPEQQRVESTGWEAPSADVKSSVPWGQTDQSKLVPSAWGAGNKPPAPAPQQGWGGGAVNPPTSQWGGQSTSSSSGTSTNNNASQQHPQGAWGSGNPFGGSKASQPSASPQQFPTSWAQAAGKGLNPSSSPKPPMPSAQNKQEDMLQKAVTSHEGWGKRPVKQDTAWDVDEPHGERKNSGAASSGSSDDGKESNHWNANNDGTAIWEATKSSAASNWGNNSSGSGSGGASGSRDRDDWGSDNDSGTWNGPPGSNSQQSSNSWSESPAPSNNTNNQWGAGSSGNSWGNNDRNNPKAYGNPSVMGNSNNWGGGGDNGQWGPPKPSQGQWENKPAGGHQWGNPNNAPPPPNQWGDKPNQWGGHDQKPPPTQWGAHDPRGPPPNQWGGGDNRGPPPPSQWGGNDNRGPPPNQWGPGNVGGGVTGSGGGVPIVGGGGGSGDWSGNQTKDDNVWDKNGTNMWGEPGKPVPMPPPQQLPQQPPPPPDNGHWGGGSGSGKSSSTSSWDDNIEPTGWDDGSNAHNQKRRSSDVDDGTSAWGDPNSTSKPSNWGAQPPPGRPPQAITGRPDDNKGPWSQPPPSQMGKPPNWGPGGGVGSEMGIFGGGPNRGGSWGDTNQWGPGGARPKAGPPGWGEPTEQWNPKKDTNFGHWGEETGCGKDIFESGEVGNWEGSQESGSSWSSARSWNRNNYRTSFKGPNNYGGMSGKQQPTQMRAKMLQQLMDMGFKKDDAQNALIRNDMDLESAIADLVASAAKRHAEDRHYDKGHKDMSDMPPDANQFMNPNLQATYSNQSQVITNHMSHAPPSLPSASSLPSLNNPAINATLQQKILQQQMAQGGPPPQGQPIRGQVNPTPQSVQQQLVQRQIVQQLKVAVQAGLISPQLLTQQLTPATLVMLQQLLQLQSVLQRLVAQQNQVFLTQSKNMTPIASKQQLEQLSVMIQKIKEQIHQQQQQINQAQMHLTKGVPPKVEGVKDLAGSLAGMGINNVQPPAPPNQLQQVQQQQQQSRLSQWKLPSPDQMIDVKGPSTRPGLHQSLSTPDLPSSGLSSLTDSTWSTTLTPSSREWPTISAPSSSGGDSDGGKDGLEKESHLPTSADSQASTGSTSSNSSGGNSNITDMIEEFVPGKPWQGIAKNVEDDPFITPGSVNRSSLSVNTIRDDYLSSLGKSTSPLSGDGNTTWSSSYGAVGSGSKSKTSTWSSSSAGDQQTDLWSGGQGKNTRPPPGLANRSMSMPVGDRQYAGRDRGQNQPISNTLILRNLTPQIDGSTLKTLCMQHGPLMAFHLNLPCGQAIVRYNAKEEAMKAQKSLNTCVLGNTTILAEFLSDAEVPQGPTSSESSTPGIISSASNSSLSDLWSQQSNSTSSAFRSGSGSGNKIVEPNQWNGSSSSIGGSGGGGSSMWSGAGLWSSSAGFEDHGLLPGDLLGGQPM